MSMNEYFQLAMMAFMSWHIEKEHGRDELSELWYKRFACLVDLVEDDFRDALGEDE